VSLQVSHGIGAPESPSGDVVINPDGPTRVSSRCGTLYIFIPSCVFDPQNPTFPCFFVSFLAFNLKQMMVGGGEYYHLGETSGV
jgi:hypothetical protein